jgi:hypothetical protein
MSHAEVSPAKELRSKLGLRWWVLLPEEQREWNSELRVVGDSPRWFGRAIQVPEHRVLGVEPARWSELDGLAAEMSAQGATGLTLRGNLPESGPGDATVQRVAREMPFLRWLELEHALVTDEAFESLAGLSRLQWLGFSNCEGFSERGLARLADHPSLSALSIVYDGGRWVEADPMLGDRALAAIGRMTELRGLRLEGCLGMSEAGAPAFSHLRSLEWLTLSFLPFGTATLEVVASLPALRYLVIDLFGANLAGVRALARAPALKEATIFRHLLPEEALRELARARPDVKLTTPDL